MTDFQEHVDNFHKNGFLVLHDVLTEDQCEELKNDIQKREESRRSAYRSKDVCVYHKMFEQSDAHLSLFSQEPVLSIAQAIIQDGVIQKVGGKGYHPDFTGLDVALQCHVIHNSAIVVQPHTGGINR